MCIRDSPWTVWRARRLRCHRACPPACLVARSDTSGNTTSSMRPYGEGLCALGRPQSFAISAMSPVNEVKGDVEDRRGMRQRADAEEVDTRLGVRPGNRQRQSPCCLDLDYFTRSPNDLDGGPDQVDGHVVAQQE